MWHIPQSVGNKYVGGKHEVLALRAHVKTINQRFSKENDYTKFYFGFSAQFLLEWLLISLDAIFSFSSKVTNNDKYKEILIPEF